MKTLLIIIGLIVAAWFGYQKFVVQGGAAAAIEDPVFAEMRATANIQGREIEMALFVRAGSDLECQQRTRETWTKLLRSCPSCTLQTPTCKKELAPRYARLFDDVPIPSPYLSATAGNFAERDGRVVVYGLTDAEGVQVCEVLKDQLLKQYKGTARCIPASGG